MFVTSGEVKAGPREDRGGGHDPDQRPQRGQPPLEPSPQVISSYPQLFL